MSDPTHLPADASTEPDLSGRQLGDYRLLRLLGRGGMAEVYLAEQTSLRRQVAFKVLKSTLANQDSYVRRFHHEAQAAARLVHANIVQIYEVGCIDGFHFIAQEYVAGLNLSQLLSRKGPVEARLGISIMRQVAAALQKAGEQSIVHRDIKPENILFSGDGDVKVADFGLARITSDNTDGNLTQVGITMGTPIYMSPEQAEGRRLDPRSDIYSFGVTCFHMLVGHPPFSGETALSVAVQHVKSEPGRLENLRPDLPEGLCRIVHTMLAKDPADRFAQAADLLRELRGLRIEGIEEDWPMAREDWITEETVTLAQTQAAATQQLDALMKTTALRVPRRITSRQMVAGILLALLVGGAVAWFTNEGSLLAVNRQENSSPIEKMDSAGSQFFHALMINADPDQEGLWQEAWRAVWIHYPGDESEYYVHRAKQKLADLYLKRGELDDAMLIFEEFSKLGPEAGEFYAYGLAKLARIYQFRGDNKQVQSILYKVWPLRIDLDEQTQQDLQQLLDGQAGEIREAIENQTPETQDNGT